MKRTGIRVKAAYRTQPRHDEQDARIALARCLGYPNGHLVHSARQITGVISIKEHDDEVPERDRTIAAENHES